MSEQAEQKDEPNFESYCACCGHRVKNEVVVGGGYYLCDNLNVLKQLTWADLNESERLGCGILQNIGCNGAVPCRKAFKVCEGRLWKEGSLIRRILGVKRKR